MSLIDSISETNAKASEAGEIYLKKSYDYYKLKIFQQLTDSVSMVFKTIAIGGMVLMGLWFLAIALALFIGKSLGSYTLGFIAVGIIFLVLSIIIFFLRKYMNNFAIKKLSKKFFN